MSINKAGKIFCTSHNNKKSFLLKYVGDSKLMAIINP